MPRLHDFRTNFRFGRLKNGFRKREDARAYTASVREATNMMVLSDQSLSRRWGTDLVKSLAAKTRIEGWIWGADETEANLVALSDGQLDVLDLDGVVVATFTEAEVFVDNSATETIVWDDTTIPFIQMEPSGRSVWITDTTFPPMELRRETDGTYSLSALKPGQQGFFSKTGANSPFFAFDPASTFSTNVWLGRGYGDVIQDLVEVAAGVTNSDVLDQVGYGTLTHPADYFTGNDVGQRFRLWGGEFEVIQIYTSTTTRIRVIENLTSKLESNPIFTRKDSTRVEIAIANHNMKAGETFLIFGASTADATRTILTAAMDIDGVATSPGTYSVDRVVDDNHIEVVANATPTADALLGGPDIEILRLSAASGITAPVFSKRYGWPQFAAVWQSRLFLGGSLSLPDAVFGSAINNFTDFKPGTGQDDEALTLYGLGGGGRILHANPGYDLMFFTSKGEHYIPGSNDVAITPETVRAASANTNIGSSYTPIVAFDGAVFHVDAPGAHIRATMPNQSEYSSKIMTIGAPDWVNGPVDSAAFAGGTSEATPYALIVNEGDGSMLVIHSAKEDDAYGAMRWTLGGGSFVSVAGIFNRLFAVANIGGTYVLLEFDTRDQGGGMDLAERFAADTGNATVTHSFLVSQAVQATEDGVAVTDRSTTAGGVYTKQTAAADDVVVGVSMPWTFSVSPPIAASGQGSNAGKMANLVDTEILFRNTTTGEVEGVSIVEDLDQPDALVAPTPVSEFRHYVIGIWDREPLLVVGGDKPGSFGVESLTMNVYF